MFSSLIPKSISNASELTLLGPTNNHFIGFILSKLSASKNLQRLNLGNNNLTIESTTSMVSILSIATFRDLRFFNLENNPLNVTLPPSIANIYASLKYLYLNNYNL